MAGWEVSRANLRWPRCCFLRSFGLLSSCVTRWRASKCSDSNCDGLCSEYWRSTSYRSSFLSESCLAWTSWTPGLGSVQATVRLLKVHRRKERWLVRLHSFPRVFSSRRKLASRNLLWPLYQPDNKAGLHKEMSRESGFLRWLLK